jgi:hypothetical protein
MNMRKAILIGKILPILSLVVVLIFTGCKERKTVSPDATVSQPVVNPLKWIWMQQSDLTPWKVSKTIIHELKY